MSRQPATFTPSSRFGSEANVVAATPLEFPPERTHGDQITVLRRPEAPTAWPLPDLPLAATPRPAHDQTVPATVQTQSEPSSPATIVAPESIQREVITQSAAVSTDSPAAMAAPAHGAHADAGGHGDLDELAHKLYDRIRFRLQAELRLDRERAGIVSDLGF
jgi:hypothetical protein